MEMKLLLNFTRSLLAEVNVRFLKRAEDDVDDKGDDDDDDKGDDNDDDDDGDEDVHLEVGRQKTLKHRETHVHPLKHTHLLMIMIMTVMIKIAMF